MTVHSYVSADHAFARNNGVTFDNDAAKQDDERTLACFKTNLG